MKTVGAGESRPEGRYAIVVEAESDRIEASCVVGLDGAASSCEEPGGAGNAGGFEIDISPAFAERGPPASLFLELWADLDGNDRVGPVDVHVTLHPEGVLVGDGVYAPEYRRLEKNGPGCGICEESGPMEPMVLGVTGASLAGL